MVPVESAFASPQVTRDDHISCNPCPVRALDLFSGLSDARANGVLKAVDRLFFVPRAPIYQSGEKTPFVYVLRVGLIKLSHYLPNGDERIVRILKPGDTAGLEALFGNPYHHTAVTLTRADVCRVPVPLMEQLDREVPDFHRQLLQQFQRSLNEAEAVLTELSTGSAHGRVARLLLFLAENDGTNLVTLISREDMGAILGITTESASRIVAEFRRAGVLTHCSGGMCRGERQRLAEIAHGADVNPRNRRENQPEA